MKLEDCDSRDEILVWLKDLKDEVKLSVIDYDHLTQEFLDYWFPNGPKGWHNFVPVYVTPWGDVIDSDMDDLLEAAAVDTDLALWIFEGYANGIFRYDDELLEAVKEIDSDYLSDNGCEDDDAVCYYTELGPEFFFDNVEDVA